MDSRVHYCLRRPWLAGLATVLLLSATRFAAAASAPVFAQFGWPFFNQPQENPQQRRGWFQPGKAKPRPKSSKSAAQTTRTLSATPAHETGDFQSANPRARRPAFVKNTATSITHWLRLDPSADKPARSARIAKPVPPNIPPSGREFDRGPTAEPATPSVVGRTGYVWSDSDSLTQIAKICGTSSDEILRMNDLRRGELEDGQVLRLPATRALPETSADGAAAPALPKSFSPEAQSQREIWRGVRGQKRIALTFDAGGEKEGVFDLLNYLQQEDAAATFFVTGEFVEKNPKVLKEIANHGYPIHNHSWSHPEFTKEPDEKIREELEHTNEIVRQTTGKETKPFFRPPFGDRDRRVLATAAEAGFQSIYWTLDSLDSVGEKKSADFVVARILNPPKANGAPDRFLDGAIILMHVGEPQTAAAVPGLIQALRERGFKLVTVDEIVRE